jgi:hypothetical protein
VLLSATGPLLQWWFSRTGHADARNPYFLYRWSNLGSLGALLAYPVIVETTLTLRQQRVGWSIGYILVILLMGACFLVMRRSRTDAADAGAPPSTSAPPRLPAAAAAPAWSHRLRWMALAAVPSSLMLAVTTYISVDIAAVPLLWVIPLAIYLLTMAIAFGRDRVPLPALSNWALPVLALVIMTIVLRGASIPIAITLPLHLTAFFVTALVCHDELSASRPDSSHLTDFYLCVAVGGVAGAAFNTLLAPFVFKTIIEYPLAVVFALLLRHRPERSTSRRTRVLDWALPAGLACLSGGTIAGLRASGLPYYFLVDLVATVVMPAAICLVFIRRPLRFALGAAAILVSALVVGTETIKPLLRERNFFGIRTVNVDRRLDNVNLVHGHIVHGIQSLSPARRREPLSYYSRGSGVGRIFETLHQSARPIDVAAIGLGTGTIAAYGRPGDRITF